MAASVALLGWDSLPIRVVQDVDWLLDDRADSTNQVRVTTSLAEADGVDAEQELIFKSRRFTISGVERDRAADEAVITADEAQAALADVVIVGFRPNSWTLTRAMNAVLDDTLWTLGEVSGTRYGRADFDEITALDALHFLARHQDARLSFDSLRRRVNITQTYGTAHEYVFTYGRQLSNITKDVQQPTTTIIYPTMADDIELPAVEDYGYYLSQGLTRDEAHERFRKEEHWSDSRYEVEENMVRDAFKRLEEEAWPRTTYTLTAQATVDVEGADDFDLAELRLGDTVRVWDQEIDTKLSAEVTAVTTSSDQSQNELTLSTLPASLGDSVSGRGYFGDSGRPSDGRRRSGPQPRPSMPILEQMGDYGIAITRWNGQDADGNFETIPQRFGTLLTLVAPLEDGVIPSPMDSSHTFTGSDITKRGGGLSNIGFNDYGEFAVWHQMRGWDGMTLSEFSEPLVVDVPPAWDPQPTVDKLDNLNDVRLPGLEQDLADAQQQADTRYSELNTRANTAEQNISDATDRLTAAETTLEPLPGDVADAKQSATAAREAAEAAEARAIEASNNAGNRIDNGGFELGLDHWITSNVTITTDTHSGDQAALVADGGTLSPASSIPVSGGDVWDISLFGKATTGTLDMAVHELDDAGNVVAVVDSFTIEATGVWVESGRQRTTMPEGSERITFEVTAVGGDWAVDDIVLRDVTDVVRLEQAARDAADKAEAAESKADALQLAVEGEGGLRDRLDTTESTLQGKAESSALDDLSMLVSGRERVRTGEGAPDETTAARGVTYEWAGTPHASESVKRIDGVEVARNLVPNPSFEGGVEGWEASGAELSLATDFYAERLWGGTGGQVFRIIVSENQSSGFATHQVASLSPGQWVAMRSLVATGGTDALVRLRARFRTPGFTYLELDRSTDARFHDGAVLVGAVQVPQGAATTEILLHHNPTNDQRLWADHVMVAAADTEADALAQVSTYFDGDTSDELSLPATEGTIYYQTDGDEIVAIWRRSEGAWVKLPLRDEVFSSISVGKLVAGDASFDTGVVNRLWGQLGVFDRLDAREGWIGGVNLENGAVTAEKMTVTDQMITDIFGANRALVEDELIVKGGLIANNADLINAAMQNLSVTERADFVSAWADELYADEFTARSSTVARQIVAARNLYNDPNFERTDLYSGWEVTSNGIRKDGTGSTSGTYADTQDMLIPAQPGERFEVTVEANFSGSGHARIYARSADSDGNHIAGTAASVVEVPITGTHRGTFEAHEDAAYVYIGFFTDQSMGSSDSARFTHARVESALDGRMIVNGLLQASTAELEQLFFDTAVGNTVAAGVGEFLELNADQIRSNSWTGIVATGATFQTHADANRGVKMTPAGLRGWDGGGDLSFRFDGSNNFLRGSLHAGLQAGSEVHIDYGLKTRTAQSEDGAGSWDIETPYIDFRGSFSYQVNRHPSIYIDEGTSYAGMMFINPGYPSGTDDYRGVLNVGGDIAVNRAVVRNSVQSWSGYQLDRSSNQPGGLTMDDSLRTRLEGRMAENSGPHDMIVHGTSPSLTLAPNAAMRGSVSFFAPAETGVRRCVVSAHVANTILGYDQNRGATASSARASASSMSYTMQAARSNSGDVQAWVYFAAYWT